MDPPKILVDDGKGATKYFLEVKWLDFPPNHNKQNVIKMCPNNNHEIVALRLVALKHKKPGIPMVSNKDQACGSLVLQRRPPEIGTGLIVILP